MNRPEDHCDPHVQRALINLLDALCQWERINGIASAFILVEEGGFKMRSLTGRGPVPDYITDEELLNMIALREADRRGKGQL